MKNGWKDYSISYPFVYKPETKLYYVLLDHSHLDIQLEKETSSSCYPSIVLLSCHDIEAAL